MTIYVRLLLTIYVCLCNILTKERLKEDVMAVSDHIKEEFIYIDKSFSSKEEALRYMGSQLEEKNVVKSTYVDAIIERERIYPTGLMSSLFGVALPHTDSVHVNESCLSVAVLKDEVTFNEMGNPDGELGVKVIIMMALKDAKSQLDSLQALMQVLQNEKKLKSIISSRDAKELIEAYN